MNVKLALGAKKVDVPKFTNEELLGMGGSEAFSQNPKVKAYQDAMKESQMYYSELQNQLANPTVNAKFNEKFGVTPEEAQRQSGAQLYGMTPETPSGKTFSPAVIRGLGSAGELFLSALLAGSSALNGLKGLKGVAARGGANLFEGALEGFAESTPQSVKKDVLWSALTEGAFGVAGETLSKILNSVKAARAMKNMDLSNLKGKTAVNTLLSDQVDDIDMGKVYYHGTGDPESFNKHGFDLSKFKGEAESPYALFVSKYPEEAKGYGEVVEVYGPKNLKVLDVSSKEWAETMGKSKNSKEAAEWAEELRRRGYDMIEEGDEEIILNPEKFKTKAQLEANKQPGKFSKALESSSDIDKGKVLGGVPGGRVKKTVSSDLIVPWENESGKLREIGDTEAGLTVDKYKNMIYNGEELEPILVLERKDADGVYYEVQNGHHRLQAYDEMGIKDIPIEIVQDSKPGKFSKALQSQYKFTPKDLVKEPNIELKSDMVVRDPSGGKVALKAGETYTPFKIEGTKKVALRDGKDYVIQAGDYEKALQNSKRAIPQPIEISKKVEPNVLWDADVQSSKNGGKLENVEAFKWQENFKKYKAMPADKLAEKLKTPNIRSLDDYDKELFLQQMADLERMSTMTPKQLADELGIDDIIGTPDPYGSVKNMVRENMLDSYGIDISAPLEQNGPTAKFKGYMKLSSGDSNYREVVLTHKDQIKPGLEDIPSQYVWVERKDLGKHYTPDITEAIDRRIPKEKKYFLVNTQRPLPSDLPDAWGETKEKAINKFGQQFEEIVLQGKPEVKKWHDSVSNFVLKEAQKGDYDGIIWSPPKEVRKRYSLSQVATEVSWQRGFSKTIKEGKGHSGTHWGEFPKNFANVILVDHTTPDGKRYLKVLEAQSDRTMAKPTPKAISEFDKIVEIKLGKNREPVRLVVSRNGIVIEESPDMGAVGDPLSSVIGTTLANRVMNEGMGGVSGKELDVGGMWTEDAYGPEGLWAKEFSKKTGGKVEDIIPMPTTKTRYLKAEENGMGKVTVSGKKNLDWRELTPGDIVSNESGEKLVVLEVGPASYSGLGGGRWRDSQGSIFLKTIPYENLQDTHYPLHDLSVKKGKTLMPVPSTYREIEWGGGVTTQQALDKWNEVDKWIEDLKALGVVKEEEVFNTRIVEPVRGIRLSKSQKDVIAGKPLDIKTTKSGKPTQGWLDNLLGSQEPVQQVNDYSYLGLDSAGDWKNIPTRNAGEFAIILAKKRMLSPSGKDIIMKLKENNIPLQGVDIGQIVARIKEVL